LRTGRDVVIAALLGADEFGFSTAPLIAMGCIMMRKCHLNTCPEGVATQTPVLRKKFRGLPEHVINYFFFVAEEARKLMAYIGVRSFDEMIGRSDFLDQEKAIKHWKACGLDMSRVLAQPDMDSHTPIYQCEQQQHMLNVLDRRFIQEAQPALEKQTPVHINAKINNTNRTIGAMLSGEIAKRFGHQGLREDTISVRLTGQAGQSFGAWAAKGLRLELEGEANDYVGKGLSGGKLIIYPPAHSAITPEESIIGGNTVLYGAICGECYFRGVAGERFAVRNSGATAVVEGCGDHGCEYMTGGCVIVLGKTGRNFAAGMSGGIAYVLDTQGDFAQHCNQAMVSLETIPLEEPHLTPSSDIPLSDSMGDIMADMLEWDAARLYLLIQNHARYTKSTRAQYILDHWKECLPQFVKIMPTDYRRALLAKKEELETAALASS